MKRGFKKFGAFLLTAVMALAMNSTVFAAVDLTDGEIGGSSTFATDSPDTQDKGINIKKELTVYNVNEAKVNAPTISYTYTVEAGDAGVSITDATTDHANNTSVNALTKAGIIPNVKITGSANNTANTAATAGSTDTSIANTISWSPAVEVDASTDGTPNYQNLNIDFTNVVFGAAGVYRYKITEALTGTGDTYAASGVTETTNATNAHIRYLDVYVRPADTFTDGTIAADWDIYGYVCVLENEAITDDGDTATTGAVKTNGFVAGTNDSTAYKADSYYTYNVTVSKTVTNDNYAKANHAFPFSVLFTNATITKAVDISSSTTGTAGGFTDPASAALSAGNTNGILTLKDSSSVKYIGIPNGTNVEVYETNDVAGVTYEVTTTLDGTDTVDKAVVSGTAPTTAVTQTTKAAYESTKATFTPTVDVDDDVAHTIAVVNNLQLISPTGFVVRFAPYMLVLMGGIFLIVLGVVLYKRTNREEA